MKSPTKTPNTKPPSPAPDLVDAPPLGTWEDAGFRLPRARSMPCEVRLQRGPNQIRVSITGDWRDVTAWRMIHLGEAVLRRMRREQAIPEDDAAGGPQNEKARTG